MTEEDKKINQRKLRDAFGCFMTGVTVVTSFDADNNPIGFTANSFSSVSMDPPLLLVSIANKSLNIKSYTEGKNFAINVLSEHQTDISNIFSRPHQDRFFNIDWKVGPIGSPLISGVSAWFDCTLEKAIEAGDHTILLGRIQAFDLSTASGLGYYRGAYTTTHTDKISVGPNVVLMVLIEHQGSVFLEKDEKGKLAVPNTKVGSKGVKTSLEELLARYNFTQDIGSVYSIYEDKAKLTQNIAFRCPTLAQDAQQDHFYDLSTPLLEKIEDPALRSMLGRLAYETRSGNFGVYFGDNTLGSISL